MSFAQPLALMFLGLSIPVVLLYLLKQKRRRVEVSTLLFWDKILRDEQTVTSLTRLKKLLSLLLQLLFIALLAFAVARPLFSGAWTGARRVVLYLDTSASMFVDEGGKTRFDLAKDKAKSIIRGLSIGDTMMLVSVASSPEIAHVFSDNRKDLLEALEKIQPTHAQSDFKQAVKLLDQLPADSRPTDVYLVTDGSFEPVDITPAEKMRFAYIKVGEASENVGISAFQVRPMPASPRDFQIHLEVVNNTGQDRQFPLELRVNKNLVDAFELTIPAGQKITRNIKQYSAEGGEVEVFADFKDPFPLDNRAYGVLPPPRQVKVALVTTNDLFLERALGTDDGVQLSVLQREEFPGTNIYDVAVFSGAHPESPVAGNAIYILNWPAGLGLSRTGMIQKPIFTEWERDHPIMRHLSLQNVSIERAAAVEKTSDFTSLASSFSDPLVLLKETPGQNTMLVAFDPTSSDLPLRIAFPIMIANAVRHLSGFNSADKWAGTQVGDILTAEQVAKFEHGAEPVKTIETPGKLKIEISPGALTPVAQAGTYYGVNSAGQTIPLFSANLASETESKIAPAENLPLKSVKELAVIKDGLRLGFEPWFALVAIAMLLSTVEWGLYHRRVIE